MVKQLYHPKFSSSIADLPVTQVTKRGVSCCEQFNVSFLRGKMSLQYVYISWKRMEKKGRRSAFFFAEFSAQHKR